MSNWVHTYKPEHIGDGTTIQNQTPGTLISKAITELQEKTITSLIGRGGVTVRRGTANQWIVETDPTASAGRRVSETTSPSEGVDDLPPPPPPYDGPPAPPLPDELAPLNLYLTQNNLTLRYGETPISAVPVVDVTLVLPPGFLDTE